MQSTLEVSERVFILSEMKTQGFTDMRLLPIFRGSIIFGHYHIIVMVSFYYSSVLLLLP